MKYLCKILLIILILPSIAHLQEKLQIEEKQAELFQIRNEISQLENNLSKKSEKEKESFDALENYNKQAFLLNKVINKFRNEEAVIQKGIEILEKKIISTKDEIDLLMHNYAVYVVALYKKGVFLEIENVINAESLRQALVRIQYLHKFSERRKDDLEEFIVKKQELLVAKTKLEFEKRKKKLLVAAKESDEKQLKIKLEEGKKILASVKKDKDELKKIIDVKKQSHEKIKSLVSKLVKEAERKEKLRKKALLASNEGIINESTLNEESITSWEYSLDTYNFSSFSELKGIMIWPLHNGKIIKRFGQSKNLDLNTITVNYGVDISAANDPNVLCVADGIISAIDWLPGYGSIIIVTHKEDYRTVYSHLSEIYVSEGEKLKTGKVIAKIGDSLDGKVLHFEIWNSRENQNPEVWLTNK
ncbi:MAG: peptidoglycan DD-metalloendopeptidase family protein [Bacteroidetes bacterium]|nr:peptidoglycan DD-metalloendopeptidase family protein [Bacteroidota bacterium]